MADAIFISYRRDDSEGEAGRLYDDLTRAFGNDAVFMDVAGIKPGVDFRKAIDDNVASCGVFLAMVGPTWTSIENPDGKRRLEDPNDFVALEIASALKREVPVIPVLVHDAKMPAVDLLPESLKSFAYHNSVEISHARWGSDVALLIEALKSYVTPIPSASEAPVHATVPVQLPAPHHPTGNIVPAVARNWKPAVFGALGGIVLLIAIIVYWVHRPDTPVVAPAANSATGASKSVSPAPSPTSDTAALDGTWIRTDNHGDADALGLLVISGTGSQMTVHAYGRCKTSACDWGQQPGTLDGPNLVAMFSPTPNGTDTSRIATVTSHAVPEGMDVLVQNKFGNPAGDHANRSEHVFIASTAPVQ